MAVQRKAISIADFERFLTRPESRNRHFELINGEIIEKVVTQKHGIIAVNVAAAIRLYLRLHPIGRVAVEARYHAPDDPDNDLLPDVSVVCDLAKPVTETGAVPYLPDLAVEIKSPDDTYKKMRDKAHYYLAHGTRIVWLIFPEKRLVEVYTAQEEWILGENEAISGGALMPGFSMPINDVFEI